jgi:hypothetical protein
MRLARWIPKATNTHSEYVTLIAFPRPTVVTRTRHNVTLYLHCLSCSLLLPVLYVNSPLISFDVSSLSVGTGGLNIVK